MNLKDMENFYIVSSHKSFSMAAKMLGVSQPTLSGSIKKLEQDLNTILFYRSKKGISLTPAGEIILNKVIKLLNIKNEIAQNSLDEKELIGTYRLGVHPIVAGYFLTNLMKQLSQKFPKTSLQLSHARSLEIQSLVQDGSVDFAVIVNPIKNPDLIIKKICDDKICIWKSSGKEIKKDQLIADMGLTQTQSILRSWPNSPTQFISTNDFHTIGSLTTSGLGYGMLPERFVLQHKLKLTQFLPKKFFKDEIAIVYRPEFGKTKVERYLIESLIDSFNLK